MSNFLNKLQNLKKKSQKNSQCSMNSHITEEKFNKFLGWLDPDRRRAAEKYEAVRRGLIIVYASRGCFESDQLADETINRVIEKIDELVENFEGDREKYFFGVARNVYREFARKRKFQLNEEITSDEDSFIKFFESERNNLTLTCLKSCLEEIDPENKQLILDYFDVESGREKEYRELIAEKYSITVNSLRVRMFRIKRDLYECIRKCLNK